MCETHVRSIVRIFIRIVRGCEGQSVWTHETVYIGFVSARSRVCETPVRSRV